jgi:peptidyl-prolyl cis-trans isomerase SurA
MRFLLITLFFCAFTLAHAQQAAKQPKPVTLFTIKKQPIFTEEFAYIYKKNNQGKAENFTDAKIQEYLDLFVNFKLKVTEAYTRGFDTTAAFQKEFRTYSEELKKPYQAEADDLDRLTKEAYQRLSEEVKAAHILILIKEGATPTDTAAAYDKIQSVYKRVSAGEDFELLASELSEDPSAKINRGNLGYFTAMQMVYPFEDAAYKLKVGEISRPVRTRFGYHLIKVFDRKPARGEVEVSHILLRTDQGEAKVKDKAFEIYDQLKGGRDWDELCKEYSDDVSTKEQGGRLRPFGVGTLSSVPEFEHVAFSLKQPGEISDPFQSSLGWHIVRLEKKISLPSYNELQASLKKRVSRDERLQVSKVALLAKRKKEFGFAETDLKNKIINLADSNLVKGKWKFTGTADLKSSVLFTAQTQKILGDEFIRYVSLNQSISALAPSAYMNYLYDRFTEQKIGDWEQEKLRQENPEYRNLLNEYKEGILFFGIMEKEVWNKASEDTVGQRNFYNLNKSKYMAGNRIEARLFSTPDKSFVEKIKGKIAAGDSITSNDLKQFRSVSNFRAYEKGESKVIDKINWAAGLQEAEDNGMYYLVQVARLVLPGIKTFSEARANVISDYQEKLEKDWIAQLKQKYPVQISEKGKKAVLKELKKDGIAKSK